MELDSAREYATNEGSTLHFAGEFGIAELLMKRIAEKVQPGKSGRACICKQTEVIMFVVLTSMFFLTVNIETVTDKCSDSESTKTTSAGELNVFES